MVEQKYIYYLQDEILQIVMGLENGFYLTGGTALHRFYYLCRYSDDLDFFVSQTPRFYEDIKEIVDAVKNKGFNIKVEVDFRDFFRVRVNEILKVDFVNDMVYRYGKSNIKDNIRLDNVINIFTNKITAIVSRDEEKDIFDLFCCAYFESFDWRHILEIASKKAPIDKETLIYRIKSFPLHWLNNLKITRNIPINNEVIDILCSDISKESTNSLYNSLDK